MHNVLRWPEQESGLDDVPLCKPQARQHNAATETHPTSVSAGAQFPAMNFHVTGAHVLPTLTGLPWVASSLWRPWILQVASSSGKHMTRHLNASREAHEPPRPNQQTHTRRDKHKCNAIKKNSAKKKNGPHKVHHPANYHVAKQQFRSATMNKSQNVKYQQINGTTHDSIGIFKTSVDDRRKKRIGSC